MQVKLLQELLASTGLFLSSTWLEILPGTAPSCGWNAHVTHVAFGFRVTLRITRQREWRGPSTAAEQMRVVLNQSLRSTGALCERRFMRVTPKLDARLPLQVHSLSRTPHPQSFNPWLPAREGSRESAGWSPAPRAALWLALAKALRRSPCHGFTPSARIQNSGCGYVCVSVCVCVCMCICRYTYIIYVFEFVFLFLFTFAFVFIRVFKFYMHVYMCLYTYLFICSEMDTYRIAHIL